MFTFFPKLIGTIASLQMSLSFPQVTAIFPDTLHVPEEIKQIFTLDAQYYLLKQCPVYLLVEYAFVEGFVKKGNIFRFLLYCVFLSR